MAKGKKKIADKILDKVKSLREQSQMQLNVETVKAQGYNAALDDVEQILKTTETATVQ